MPDGEARNACDGRRRSAGAELKPQLLPDGRIRFAHDSLLVEAVTSELVSETTISGLLECGWGLSDR